MINQITNPYAPQQIDNQQFPLAGNERKTADVKSGRTIEDKVDLSLEARKTLEEHRAARRAERDNLKNEIFAKGFRGWATEYHKEKLEAEVRAQVLRSFGLSEDEYAKLDSEVQQRIQEIIEAKAREKMEEQMAKELEKSKSDSTTAL